EGRVVEASARAAVGRRSREPLTRDDAGCTTLRLRSARGRLASGAAAGLTPAAAGPGSIAGSKPGTAGGGTRAAAVPEAGGARPIAAVPAPARLHPPWLARADEAGKSLGAELLARRWARTGLTPMDAFLVAPAQLRSNRIAAEHRVDGLGDIGMDGHALPVLDLDDHVERGWRLAFEDALLGPPAAGFLVAEGHALDPADEIGQGRVQHQVIEVVAVGGADQLDAALGDRAGGLGLELRSDLVDDDDLGHVVLDCLDHHLVLHRGPPNMHPAGLADGRMGNVAIA